MGLGVRMTDDEIRLFSELEAHVNEAKQYRRIADQTRNDADRKRANAHLTYVVVLANRLMA